MDSTFNEKKKRIEKLRASRPVEITGEEYNGKYELNRESAKAYIKDFLRNEYVNNDTGDKVLISRESANKITSHSMGNEAHLKSIVAIPRMIEKAIFIDEQENEKGNSKFDSYRYYLVGLKIAGADYTARLTVGVKQGTRYYDHNLTQIEKGKLLDAISPVSSGFTTKGGAPDLLIPQGKDTKLISILQTNNTEHIKKNQACCQMKWRVHFKLYRTIIPSLNEG